ncbi:MAG: AtpZ/AtpI family protein [Thermogutta sp.]|nr:AtpZ/AtpI family protein [Thermogutta sp.]HOP77821.1 AtpZ/AtpI family protein [Thermogutta sp.]HPU07334.1 AtpZ/AtpI family protein [Thermogutta sp.]HQF14541.1 AtpZ/AtpI family protein [Thermogutta sp.]
MGHRQKRSTKDTRATWVMGYQISSQIITIALELVLPSLMGFFADRKWHTFPALTLVGVLIGFSAGTLHFVQFAKGLNHSRAKAAKNEQSRQFGEPKEPPHE